MQKLDWPLRQHWRFRHRRRKMATIAPSLGAAISMATYANIVTKNVDGIELTEIMMEVGAIWTCRAPVVYNTYLWTPLNWRSIC